MVQTVYDDLIISDIPEMFAELGRSVTFRKVSMADNDSGDITAAVVEANINTIIDVVEISQEEDRRFGSNTEWDSSEFLIPANVIKEVRPNDEILDDNGETLKITEVLIIRPGRDIILFWVQVRI